MSMLPQCRQMLHQMKLLRPQYELDGYHNVWIFKPGAKSRGRGMYFIMALPRQILFLPATFVVQVEQSVHWVCVYMSGQ